MSGINFLALSNLIKIFNYNFLNIVQNSLNEGMENLEERINEITTKLKDIEFENQNLKNQLQKKPIFFDFGLSDHVYSNGHGMLKFDLERTSSDDKPYNSASGVFHVTRSGLYFFHVYYIPRLRGEHSFVDIYINREISCRAQSKLNNQSASCAIVRFLNAGEHVFVMKIGQIWMGNPASSGPYTGFMGVLLQ